MTKEQADAKLAVLPLTSAVTTYYQTIEDEPYLTYQYMSGNSVATISLPMNPNLTNLQNLSANLPLQSSDRLAALAILVSPTLPSNG
jgi:hypothetical protein